MSDQYSLRELFEDLPISLRQLATDMNVNEVTLARIRDGRPTYRATANKLLIQMGKIYNRELNLRNVTGFNIKDGGKQQKQKKPTMRENKDNKEEHRAVMPATFSRFAHAI